MSRVTNFFYACVILSFVEQIVPKSLSQHEKYQIEKRTLQAKQLLRNLFDNFQSNVSIDNSDFILQFLVQKNQVKGLSEEFCLPIEIIDLYKSFATDIDLYQSQIVFEDENKYESMNNINFASLKTNKNQFYNYVRLATAIFYYGYKGYKFFVKDTAFYTLQEDVLNVPYKKMIYIYTKAIERLFEGVEQKNNIEERIKSLLLLFIIPVPEWYIKHFEKGLDILYKHSFDDYGNIINIDNVDDIKLFFKVYCKKVPQSWQEIAKISDWWYKNKKAYPFLTKYNKSLSENSR